MVSDMRSLPSPNYDDRPAGHQIDMVILHYTGMVDATSAINRLTDPASQVSAHYTIDEDGTIYQHVHEEKRAWHAGMAFWRGDRAINARSIGIELVNPGHEFGYRAFPDIQIAQLTNLLGVICVRHQIPQGNILAHSDVAPNRKQDPGELFPWSILARAGFGLWPDETSLAPVLNIADALTDIGYDPAHPGESLIAFRRHWVPEWFQNPTAPDQTSLRLAQLVHQTRQSGLYRKQVARNRQV